MGLAMVKCLYCGKTFDRNKEPNQKIGRRYVHQECYEENYTESDFYKEQIYNFLKTLYGTNYKYQAIEAQRKSYLKKGMTNKGIYQSLKYFFEIKKGSLEKTDGRIGIVPYVYDEAEKYYEKLNQMAKNLAISVQKCERERVVDVDLIDLNNRRKNKKIDMSSLE